MPHDSKAWELVFLMFNSILHETRCVFGDMCVTSKTSHPGDRSGYKYLSHALDSALYCSEEFTTSDCEGGCKNFTDHTYTRNKNDNKQKYYKKRRLGHTFTEIICKCNKPMSFIYLFILKDSYDSKVYTATAHHNQNISGTFCSDQKGRSVPGDLTLTCFRYRETFQVGLIHSISMKITYIMNLSLSVESTEVIWFSDNIIFQIIASFRRVNKWIQSEIIKVLGPEGNIFCFSCASSNCL